jgi:hypothetical protein
LRDINDLEMSGFRGRPGSRDPAVPAVLKERVTTASP